jgi:hypothetical protein
VTNKPIVFGYKNNKNILPDPKLKTLNTTALVDGYLEEHDFSGQRMHDYPYSTPDVFDLNEVIKAF